MNQRGAVPILILIAIVGVIAFLGIAALANFTNKIFENLFPKPPSHAATIIGKYDVFETTLTYSTSGISSPQDPDVVKVNATFTSPSNKTLNIEGFYYDTNTYKVRFTPAEIGTYNYSITIQGPNGNPAPTIGTFDSIASNRKGFIRKHPSIPYKLVFEDGSNFFGIGFNTCWGANNADPNNGPVREWIGTTGFYSGTFNNEPIGEGGTSDVDLYFKKYAENGFNLFRWHNGNCSPTYNNGSVAVGKQADQMLTNAKKYDFHNMYTFFGTGGKYVNAQTNPTDDAALKKELRHLLARFGAYVDIWEVTNESFQPDIPTDSYLGYVRSYLRSIDPYQRPVTNSNTRTTDATIPLDLQSPHTYGAYWYGYQGQNKPNGSLPAVIGEAGNGGNITKAENEYLYRTNSWHAFFGGTGLAYWSSTGSFPPGQNMYIGSAERRFTKVLSDFAVSFSADAAPSTLSTGTNASAYRLSSSTAVGAYLYVAPTATHSGTANITLNIPFDGTAKWIDPVTGQVLSTQPVTAGNKTFTAPNFAKDIALLVTSTSAPTPSPAPTPIPDTQPPSAPTNLTARTLPRVNATANWAPVQFSWNASSDNNPGITYRLFRGNIHVGTTSYTLFESPENLSTTSTYKVDAVDQAGNVTSSQTISYTTPSSAGPFSTPILYPVTSVSPSPSPSAIVSPSPSASPSATPNPLPGDIIVNGRVDIFDYNQLLSDFGKSGTGLISDIVSNNRVDIFDYNLLLSNFGKSVP